MKKLSHITLSLIVSLVALLGFQSATFAKPKEPSTPTSPQVVEKIVPENPDEFIKEKGWEKPTKDAKLVEVVRVSAPAPTSDPNSTVTPMWGSGLYVKKIGGERDACGTTVRARVSGVGNANGVLQLIQTVTVSNTFSANASVSAEVVSAGVGFDVSKSWTTTASYSVNTGGKNYQIVAYDDYRLQDFEIWDDPYIGSDYKVGSGTAKRQVGFCYAVYQI
jgi:hypothetical protein